MAESTQAVAYGERLLPQVLDELANNDPNRVYASYAKSADISEGFRHVTVKEMASAVDSLAWWIEARIGKSNNFGTLAFIGASDLRYPILCLAGMKCGWKILLLGPRNSTTQNESLMRRTSSTILLHTTEVARIIKELKSLMVDMSTMAMKPLDELLSHGPERYPYDKTFVKAEKDPVLVLHSSGSTGSPKLVTMTHGTFSVTDNDRNMPIPEGRKAQNAAQFNFEDGGGFFSCFPPYHLAGIQAMLVLPIFTSATIVIGPTTRPTSGLLVTEIIHQQHQMIRALYVPPSILEEWVSEPIALEQAKHLDFVLFGGGSLSSGVGDSLSHVTDVCQMYGSAETGQIQILIPRKGEWPFMEWNPYEEVDMQPSGDGAFEMVLHYDAKFAKRRSLNHNFPDIRIWRSGDLFIPHSKKPGLWRFHARVDDLIVLSNGHKINPGAIETALMGHPLLSGAIVLGTGQVRPALLLEFKTDVSPSKRQEAKEMVWQIVRQVNSTAPAYGQILRSMVACSDPGRPFVRSPKGNIVRHSTIEVYAGVIESLYLDSLTHQTGPEPDSFSHGDLTSFLHKLLASILPEADLKDQSDLFNLGMDSLKVAELLSSLQHGLKNQINFDRSKITLRLVYDNPTISRLVLSLQHVLDPSLQPSQDIRTLTRLEDTVSRFTANLPPSTPTDSNMSDDKYDIVLTGSTGTLGLRLLGSLSQSSRITRIHCLVRSSRSISDYESMLADYGLEWHDLRQKVEIIRIDFSKDRLGLDDPTYAMLLTSVNLIVHLAWAVDFNLILQSFESYHLRGLRSLIDLSAQSQCRAQIVFSSSTSYATAWAAVQDRLTVPETLLTSEDNIAMGYGESKQVAEHILSVASKCCNIPIKILRIGQIAGPRTAICGRTWPKDEWVPSLMKTSNSLGLIPDMDLSIDWIPVDELADIVVEIILEDTHCDNTGMADGLKIYNVVNPACTRWATFSAVLRRQWTFAKVIPLQQWIEVLTTHGSKDLKQLKSLPALKLMSFFHILLEQQENMGRGRHLKFVLDNACGASTTLTGLQPIEESVVETWSRKLD